MKRLAIINPWSGNGSTGRKIPKILAALKGIIHDYVVTRHPGDCRKAAEQASGFECIVAVGGDGTVCETIRGMDLSRQTLAVIPSGTGNSLARDLNLCTLHQSASTAAHGRIQQIDVMSVLVTTRDGKSELWYSASTISFGYVVRCTKLSNSGFKNLGRLCYPVVSILCAVRKRLIPMVLQYDGARPVCRNLSGLVISNTCHAANFKAFPNAKIDDGLSDVLEIRGGFFRQMAHNISVLSGKHFYLPVSIKQSANVQARLNSPHDLLIDGELISDVISVLVAFLPKRLKCYTAA